MTALDRIEKKICELGENPRLYDVLNIIEEHRLLNDEEIKMAFVEGRIQRNEELEYKTKYLKSDEYFTKKFGR